MRENNSREAFLAGALSLFSEKGYDATSTNDIVEKVGVTRPTLYYFFGSKEGLFEELLRVHNAVLDRQLEGACRYTPAPENYEADVFPFLLGIVKTVFAFARDNTPFYLMMLTLSFAPAASRQAVLAEPYLKRQYLLLEDAFRQVSAAHPGLRGKEREASWEFMALINTRIGFWNHGHGEIDEAAARHIVKQFLHGLFA